MAWSTVITNKGGKFRIGRMTHTFFLLNETKDRNTIAIKCGKYLRTIIYLVLSWFAIFGGNEAMSSLSHHYWQRRGSLSYSNVLPLEHLVMIFGSIIPFFDQYLINNCLISQSHPSRLQKAKWKFWTAQAFNWNGILFLRGSDMALL